MKGPGRFTGLTALFLFAAYAQDLRKVTEPVIPPVATTVLARLAEIDETKPDTARIQQAIDHCAPGKAVELKADGARKFFLSGPLELHRGVTLVVAGGATLVASRNPRDYDLSPGVCGTVDDRGRGCKPLIRGDGIESAGVMGDGVIDGRGGARILGQNITWWDLAEQARDKGAQNCPRILILNRCNNFTLYRITLKNSPNFHVSYNGGNGFTVWGVKVWSPGKGARNTDGIDPGNSTNVTITRCFIHTGDDNVAIKAGKGDPTTHMTITHNHFYTGHGMSIGSNTDGGASAIRVSDLSIDGADNGIRIKSNSGRGGLVHDVVYEDVCIRNTKVPIYMDSDYQHYGKGGTKIPAFNGITLRNVRIQDSGKITLDGYDNQHRLGIAFDNVVLDTPSAIKMTSTYADITLGPGPVNFRPSGEAVRITGNPGKSAPNSCAGKFVDFPGQP